MATIGIREHTRLGVLGHLVDGWGELEVPVDHLLERDFLTGVRGHAAHGRDHAGAHVVVGLVGEDRGDEFVPRLLVVVSVAERSRFTAATPPPFESLRSRNPAASTLQTRSPENRLSPTLRRARGRSSPRATSTPPPPPRPSRSRTPRRRNSGPNPPFHPPATNDTAPWLITTRRSRSLSPASWLLEQDLNLRPGD